MLVVNGEEIADSLVREEAALLRPKYYEVMDAGDPIELEMQLRDWSRENVIERVLLSQEAARRGVEVAELLKSVSAVVPASTDLETRAFYKKNRESLWTPEQVHAAHVVKLVDAEHMEAEALAGIEQARDALAQGEEFGAVAERYSDGSGNGDLGWFPRGLMGNELDQVVFGLAIGEVSPIFRSEAGFHIATVMDKKGEGVPPYAGVREHLAEQMVRVRQQHAVERFVDELRERAVITGAKMPSKLSL